MHDQIDHEHDGIKFECKYNEFINKINQTELG